MAGQPEAGNKKPLKTGASRRYLLRLSRIVPVTGLALAPWRLHQVAGWSLGHYPHTTLDAIVM
jgi:hypothetical protein